MLTVAHDRFATDSQCFADVFPVPFPCPRGITPAGTWCMGMTPQPRIRTETQSLVKS